ncbi:Stress responsive A/B barrel domain protein [Tolypocladium paradoxum]|uniref:Stress responsive A/B barrel domain protein n=1 Tax=Tolypocladium paradoxum TaxID=94208 RepID=A0A2S4KRH2_9HYPO|nr:Stress responsive A/B barrel domain protein [Tolypocladium paradoxum]
MTVIHIGQSPRVLPPWCTRRTADTRPHPILFKFRPDVSESHKAAFVQELKALKDLPSVLNQRLVAGGPSITDPVERSKGYHFALLSCHRDRVALEYQARANTIGDGL